MERRSDRSDGGPNRPAAFLPVTRWPSPGIGFLVIAVALAAALLGGCASSSPTDPGGGASTRLVYTALGASDAVGIGAFPLSEGYVYEIAERMRGMRDDVRLHNLGISGAEVDEFVDDMLAPAVATAPDVITIWTGSNDIIGGRAADRFATDLNRLLGELTEKTDALIFVGDLADLTQAPYFVLDPDPDVTAARVLAFNARIHSAVAAHGAVLVPLSTDLELTPSVFSIDGFHPSNEGHERMAEIFWNEIRPRL